MWGREVEIEKDEVTKFTLTYISFPTKSHCLGLPGFGGRAVEIIFPWEKKPDHPYLLDFILKKVTELTDL